jgi:DNA-binding transcriptional ArsR family regulator
MRHSLEDPLEAETLAGGLRLLQPVEALFGVQAEQATIRFCATLLNSLGHPTRLRIVGLLKKGPMSVGAISSELNISQANASQHLAVLLRAGAVVREASGTSRRYSLREPGMRRILERIEAFWHELREDLEAEQIV